MSAADVDGLTKSTHDSMLKTLLGMAQNEKDSIDISQGKGSSTAVEM